MGKLTISMAIFNSYVTNYQRVYPINIPLNHYKIPLNHYKMPLNHYKIPLNHYKIPLNHYKIPLSHYKIPLNHYKIPLNHYFDITRGWIGKRRFPAGRCSRMPRIWCFQPLWRTAWSFAVTGRTAAIIGAAFSQMFLFFFFSETEVWRDIFMGIKWTIFFDFSETKFWK